MYTDIPIFFISFFLITFLYLFFKVLFNDDLSHDYYIKYYLILITASLFLITSFFLKEKVSTKKWALIIACFLGIILIGFDPNLKNEKLALILAIFMSFFYGGTQVFSRYLKELDVIFTNAFMALVG